MLVVADTSPINYLLLIGHIGILPKIYGEILIPQSVCDELRDGDAPPEVRVWIANPPAWLRTSEAVYETEALLDVLDLGERDAILLAESVPADRLILDDLHARREAQHRRLPVIGTLGVLAEASRRNLLDLSRAVAALEATNFHIAPPLVRRLLQDEANRRKV